MKSTSNINEDFNKKARKAFNAMPEVSPNLKNEIRFDAAQLKPSKFKDILLYYDSISIAPIEFLMTGLLASLSGAVGKKRFFKMSNTTVVYLNIWAVIIGKSTIMKKSTALNIVTEELAKLEKLSQKEYKKIFDGYKRKLETMTKEEKREIEKPKRNYYLYPQDSTVESLAEILSISERGLLVHNEFGSFLENLNRGYSGGAKSFLTSIYDVPEFHEVSRVTKENTMLDKPFISIIGASTIDWIQENSTPSDLRSGFAARFLYSIRNVPDKEFIPLFKLKEYTKKSENYVSTNDIYYWLTTLNENKELQSTRSAENLYTNFEVKENYRFRNGDYENENEVPFKSRLVTATLKIAGLIALCDKREVVNENDMLDALAISEYYKSNIEYLLNKEIVKTEFQRNEDKILRYIEKRNGEVSRSQLITGTGFKSKELNELLTNLMQKELIEVSEKETYEPEKKRSYTSRVYKLT